MDDFPLICWDSLVYILETKTPQIYLPGGQSTFSFPE